MAAPNEPSSRNAPAPSGGGGFAWDGDLAEVNVQALYAACHALRFSGRLELRDDSHQAKVVFLGGDPVEIDGGDTQMIALWNAGHFRAIQSLPNLSGELTDQTEQTGSLAITQGKRLLAWVSEYRLSCEITIERPGEKAALAFKNGQLESASVNGVPELAALGRVTAWTDGFYRVSLKPLFGGDVVSLAPPNEGSAPEGREFDVSRSIPLDLKLKAHYAAGANKLRVGEVDRSIEDEREALRRKNPEPAFSTDLIDALPPRALGVQPRSRWPIVVSGLLVAGAAVVGALYALHLPPFSPLPRPAIVEPKVPGVVPPTAAIDAAIAAEPAVDGAVAVEPAKNTKPTKSIKEATLEPKPEQTGPALPVEQSADARLIEKGRLLLIDGHPHSAVALFRNAEKANPKNPLPRQLEQQAIGKLGHAELELVGKGSIIVDGKRFDAPRKLKLFAGPHAIDLGEGAEETVIKKNDHKKIHVRP